MVADERIEAAAVVEEPSGPLEPTVERLELLVEAVALLRRAGYSARLLPPRTIIRVQRPRPRRGRETKGER